MGWSARAVMAFLSVNTLTRGLPASFAVKVPGHLAFLDPSGDGFLKAEDLKILTNTLSLRMLKAFLPSCVSYFIIRAKQPPEDFDPDSRGESALEFFWAKLVKRKGMYVICDLIVSLIFIANAMLQWLTFIGLSPETVLTFGGVGGLAFGLAAQHMVGNFIAGVLILVTQPFALGDFIETNDYQGYVRAIKWNFTTVETNEGRMVLLPNNVLLDNVTTNRSQGQTRCLDVEVPIQFSTSNGSKGFDRCDEILRGLEQHVAELFARSRADLAEPPAATFLGVDGRRPVPIPFVQMEVILVNDLNLGEIDDINSTLQVAVVSYLKSQGCI